jgi:lysophospholipase L1-like esterase
MRATNSLNAPSHADLLFSPTLMTPRFLPALAALGLLALLAFAPVAPGKIKVYLIGDSTMSIKQVKAYPETGWGMPFAAFFDETVTVDNRAQNGRSTKTFLAENRWQPVVRELHEGDYVFIQFGHNDEVPTKGSYTPEADFTANLKRFISETRSHKGQPVLLTPVARRKFDAAGKVRGVARETATPLIDLDMRSQALLQEFGPENSKLLFNYLAPGEHPNYPDGREDNTHFSELGARRMAELVLADIRALKLGLADRIVQGTVKKTVDAQAR